MSSAGAIFDRLAQTDAEPEQIAAELGLAQVSDTGAIEAAIDSVLSQNPKALQDYKGGKQAAFNALFGMVMKNAKGLNPNMVREELRKKLRLP